MQKLTLEEKERRLENYENLNYNIVSFLNYQLSLFERYQEYFKKAIEENQSYLTITYYSDIVTERLRMLNDIRQNGVFNYIDFNLYAPIMTKLKNICDNINSVYSDYIMTA